MGEYAIILEIFWLLHISVQAGGGWKEVEGGGRSVINWTSPSCLKPQGSCKITLVKFEDLVDAFLDKVFSWKLH